MKIYAKDSSILIQEKKALEDGKYKSSEGWPVELSSGKLIILKNENLKSNNTKTNVKSTKKTKSQKGPNSNDTSSTKPMNSVKTDAKMPIANDGNGDAKEDSLKTTPSSKISIKQNVIHKVAANETLTSIAKKYNITVSELKIFNDLPSDDIEIGQELKIESN